MVALLCRNTDESPCSPTTHVDAAWVHAALLREALGEAQRVE